MQEEIWKDIPEYEGIYQISNLGRVKSLSRYIYNNKNTTKGHLSREKILRLSADSTGYLQVNLSKNGKKAKFHVHRLVAKLFIPNPDNKPQVNHIDRNRRNPAVSNLEWVTDSENKFHAWKNPNRISTKKEVIQIDKNDKIIKTWDSIQEAEKSLKISHISECCRNPKRTSGGYKWKYKEEKMGIKITGENYIFKNENGRYSTSISNRKDDGSYENTYLQVQFRKGVELENKTKINITNSFLTFYKNQEGKPVFKIVVLDFEQEGEAKEPEVSYADNDSLPF